MEEDITYLVDIFIECCEDYILSIDLIFNFKDIIAGKNKHNKKEIFAFYDSEENQQYINSAITALKDYWNLKTTVSRSSDFNIDLIIKNIRHSIDAMYYLLLVAFVKYMNEPKTPIWKENQRGFTLENLESLYEFEGTNIFFRGQSEFNWPLTPSILRDVEENVVINDDYYYYFLNKYKLYDKYKKHIAIPRGKDNTYDRYAFFQHACSFSPLIDFTKNKIAALSFALGNRTSFHKYANIASSIYVISLNPETKSKLITSKKDAKRFLKKDFSITNLNIESICFGKEYKANSYSKDGIKTVKIIKFDSFKTIKEQLTPEVVFIDIPTNDRMIYQEGLFLVFSKCIALDHRIFYELNKDFTFVKLVIDPKNKYLFKSRILKKHREFDIDHLLNPYLIFNE